MNKILIFILLIIALFFGYGIYSNINKKSAKTKRIACQDKTITFESLSSKKLISKAQELYSKGQYKILSDIEYSKLMNSVLINHLSKDDLEALVSKKLPPQKKNLSNEFLLIDYYVYENDKKDSNKKNDKAKLYAGYLVFEFKLGKKLVYKIQTDYMKQDASDIENRVDCVIKSFKTIKGD